MPMDYFYREIGIPKARLKNRHFHLTVNLLQKGHPDAWSPTDPALKPFPFRSVRELAANAPQEKYAPVSKCIYCGATEYEPGRGGALSDEHIIPEGLGARLLLPSASCRNCQEGTSKVEIKNLRRVLWAPRKALGIRGKKQKHEVARFPLMVRQVDGCEVQVDLPIEHHPALLVMPAFLPPGIFRGRPSGEPNICGAWVYGAGTMRRIRETSHVGVLSPTVDVLVFAQMLAKIAHAFAVAEIGAGAFKPVLQEFITHDFKPNESFLGFYDHVGGFQGNYEKNNALHVIGIERDQKMGRAVVAMRLFASLGGPLYVIDVGELR